MVSVPPHVVAPEDAGVTPSATRLAPAGAKASKLASEERRRLVSEAVDAVIDENAELMARLAK
jgi:hypothetical protein